MFKNIFKRLPPYGAKDLEGGALNGPKNQRVSLGINGRKIHGYPTGVLSPRNKGS